MIAVVFGAVIWTVVALGVGVLVGKGITLADKQEQPDEDWLADQPAECLSPVEVNRRCAGFEAWL